jgi:hypothetical protein
MQNKSDYVQKKKRPSLALPITSYLLQFASVTEKLLMSKISAE